MTTFLAIALVGVLLMDVVWLRRELSKMRREIRRSMAVDYLHQIAVRGWVAIAHGDCPGCWGTGFTCTRELKDLDDLDNDDKQEPWRMSKCVGCNGLGEAHPDCAQEYRFRLRDRIEGNCPLVSPLDDALERSGRNP